MKYFANYHVNGTYAAPVYVGHNKKQLLKDIREICVGEWHKGDFACYYIHDESDRVAYFANILPNGVIRYFTKNYVDKF